MVAVDIYVGTDVVVYLDVFFGNGVGQLVDGLLRYLAYVDVLLLEQFRRLLDFIYHGNVVDKVGEAQGLRIGAFEEVVAALVVDGLVAEQYFKVSAYAAYGRFQLVGDVVGHLLLHLAVEVLFFDNLQLTVFQLFVKSHDFIASFARRCLGKTYRIVVYVAVFGIVHKIAKGVHHCPQFVRSEGDYEKKYAEQNRYDQIQYYYINAENVTESEIWDFRTGMLVRSRKNEQKCKHGGV